MNDKSFDYPALYETAGELAAESQTSYLNLLRGEYALLILAAILSLDLSNSRVYFVAYAFVFLLSLGVLLTRQTKKPEQDWYKGRALGESVKTSCWRYCMRAEPFGDAESVLEPRAEFRNHLRAILDANRHIGERMPPKDAANDQITESMEKVRASSLSDRKVFYDVNRIREQRGWYTNKALLNRKASRRWVRLGVGTYVVAILLVLARIAYPDRELWPIEPLIVIASSILGWMQIKKFNELASSYTLTAHEIGIVQGRLAEITTEPDFSEFVNDAEQAFSREHTQWVARQQMQ